MNELKTRLKLVAVQMAVQLHNTDKPTEFQIQMALEGITKLYNNMTPEQKTECIKGWDELFDRVERQGGVK